jgi:hypothetical protein
VTVSENDTIVNNVYVHLFSQRKITNKCVHLKTVFKIRFFTFKSSILSDKAEKELKMIA